jgi:hypothetical protein
MNKRNKNKIRKKQEMGAIRFVSSYREVENDT